MGFKVKVEADPANATERYDPICAATAEFDSIKDVYEYLLDAHKSRKSFEHLGWSLQIDDMKPFVAVDSVQNWLCFCKSVSDFRRYLSIFFDYNASNGYVNE